MERPAVSQIPMARAPVVQPGSCLLACLLFRKAVKLRYVGPNRGASKRRSRQKPLQNHFPHVGSGGSHRHSHLLPVTRHFSSQATVDIPLGGHTSQTAPPSGPNSASSSQQPAVLKRERKTLPTRTH